MHHKSNNTLALLEHQTGTRTENSTSPLHNTNIPRELGWPAESHIAHTQHHISQHAPHIPPLDT